MATTSTILMTADELAQLPRGGDSHELVYGEIRTMSPSGNLSTVVALNIGFVIKTFLKTRPGFGVACGAEGGFRLTLYP